MATRLLYLDLGGRHVALSGEYKSAGQGAGAQAVLVTVLVSPVGIFARGNNAKLKAGQIIEGRLVDDFAPDAGALAATP